MRKSIPVSSPNPEAARTIVKGIKKITDQTGKHKYIAKMARLSDLSEDKLVEVASKMTRKERRQVFKAFMDLQRVVTVIANSEIEPEVV